jgi:Domain of unknown function (DUF3850)
MPRRGRGHVLKCWPPYWADVASGRKSFELRRDDRGFNEGDVLILREFDPFGGYAGDDGEYTGRTCERRVSYVLCGPAAIAFGLVEGYVVLGLASTQEVAG